MSVSEFLHMGGYGFYVWTSYAIAFIVLLINWIAIVRRGKQVLRDVSKRVGAQS